VVHRASAVQLKAKLSPRVLGSFLAGFAESVVAQRQLLDASSTVMQQLHCLNAAAAATARAASKLLRLLRSTSHKPILLLAIE